MNRLILIGLACCFSVPFRQVSAEPVAIMDFEFRYRSPVTSILVNGVDLSLLVDLGGSNAVALTKEELLLTKPKFIGETGKHQFLNGETYTSRKFTLDSVAFGSVLLTNVLGREYFRASFSPKDLPGHIGIGILGQFQVIINYPEKTISLFKPTVPSITFNECNGGNISELDIFEGTIRSKVSFGGENNYLFAWDTGASHNIVSPTVFPESEIPDLIIGGESYGPTPVRHIEIEGAPFDGLIGYDFFMENLVCFDFERKLVAIRKFPT